MRRLLAAEHRENRHLARCGRRSPPHAMASREVWAGPRGLVLPGSTSGCWVESGVWRQWQARSFCRSAPISGGWHRLPHVGREPWPPAYWSEIRRRRCSSRRSAYCSCSLPPHASASREVEAGPRAWRQRLAVGLCRPCHFELMGSCLAGWHQLLQGERRLRTGGLASGQQRVARAPAPSCWPTPSLLHRWTLGPLAWSGRSGLRLPCGSAGCRIEADAWWQRLAWSRCRLAPSNNGRHRPLLAGGGLGAGGIGSCRYLARRGGSSPVRASAWQQRLTMRLYPSVPSDDGWHRLRHAGCGLCASGLCDCRRLSGWLPSSPSWPVPLPPRRRTCAALAGLGRQRSLFRSHNLFRYSSSCTVFETATALLWQERWGGRDGAPHSHDARRWLLLRGQARLGKSSSGRAAILYVCEQPVTAVGGERHWRGWPSSRRRCGTSLRQSGHASRRLPPEVPVGRARCPADAGCPPVGISVARRRADTPLAWRSGMRGGTAPCSAAYNGTTTIIVQLDCGSTSLLECSVASLRGSISVAGSMLTSM